jgi:hypothetical protein
MCCWLKVESVPHNRRVRRGKVSNAEKELRAAFPRGAWLDLRAGVADLDDPAAGQSWGPARTLRAEAISGPL